VPDDNSTGSISGRGNTAIASKGQGRDGLSTAVSLRSYADQCSVRKVIPKHLGLAVFLSGKQRHCEQTAYEGDTSQHERWPSTWRNHLPSLLRWQHVSPFTAPSGTTSATPQAVFSLPQ